MTLTAQTDVGFAPSSEANLRSFFNAPILRIHQHVNENLVLISFTYSHQHVFLARSTQGEGPKQHDIVHIPLGRRRSPLGRRRLLNVGATEYGPHLLCGVPTSLKMKYQMVLNPSPDSLSGDGFPLAPVCDRETSFPAFLNGRNGFNG